MFCENCGSWINDGDLFCSNCGSAAPDANDQASGTSDDPFITGSSDFARTGGARRWDPSSVPAHTGQDDPMPNPFSEEGRRRAQMGGYNGESESHGLRVEDRYEASTGRYGAADYNDDLGHAGGTITQTYVAPPVDPVPTPQPKMRGIAVVILSILAVTLAAAIAGIVLVRMGVIRIDWISDSSDDGGTPEPVYDDFNAVVADISNSDPLDVQYVSCDVSNYPTVRLYYSVRDSSGASVQLLSPRVALAEGISGGKQLEREVRSFAQVEGNEGVSYDLVVDTSDSMEGDIGRVRDILGEFVDELDYGAGDQAELLSFDSYVMYLCTYTNDVDLLRNGISSMTPYGNTALYDALWEGIGNAGSQRGARCVIAFTDGQDNESVRTADDVVNRAETYDVPVFIIGTGGADYATLESIASRTGGRYWDISDISDLSAILDEISSGEKELYCVEYTTDASSSIDDVRNVSLAILENNQGAKTYDEVHFVSATQPQKHSERYELVQADISWTEANEEAIRKGGHLVTITSQSEMNTITQMAERAGLRFVWMGGYTSTSNGKVFGHWVTGEDFGFQAWYPGEPSRNDLDGTPEMYLILWRVKKDSGWTWNDERDRPHEDPEMSVMRGAMGYVIEYEDAN